MLISLKLILSVHKRKSIINNYRQRYKSRTYKGLPQINKKKRTKQ